MPIIVNFVWIGGLTDATRQANIYPTKDSHNMFSHSRNCLSCKQSISVLKYMVRFSTRGMLAMRLRPCAMYMRRISSLKRQFRFSFLALGVPIFQTKHYVLSQNNSFLKELRA